MDMSCNIIRDLLPLYAEDLVSADSRKLVDEHLCRCDGCTKALAELLKKPEIPAQTSLEPLNKVKQMIRRRRVLSVLAAVLTLLTLASFTVTFLFAPFQLTKEQALDDFYVREDGAIVIDYSDAVIGRGRFGTEENRMLLEYSTRYDMWKGTHREPIEKVFGTDGTITEEEQLRYEDIEIMKGYWARPDGSFFTDDPIFVPPEEDWIFVPESKSNWWYADPCGLGRDTLLHDDGKAHSHQYTFSLVYPILFFGSLAAVFVFWLLHKVRKPTLSEVASRFCILFASLAFSTLFVSSGRIFTATMGVIDQYWGWMISVNTVLLTLTLLTTRQLRLLSKHDRV